MRTLLLLRHAKSSRDDPGIEDFERPLAPRGRKAAPRIGRLMRERDLMPALVLCSPARRARETWDLAASALDFDGPVRLDKRLYLADSAALLERLRACPGRAQSVLILGHNPGLGELACRLTGRGPKRDLARLRRKFPTGALAVLRFDAARWSEVEPGGGELALYAVPRELDDG
jgi:phosphohistidine phosphatase